jgi:hypothetical protein
MSKSSSVIDRIYNYLVKKSPERFTLQEMVDHFSFNNDAAIMRFRLEKLLSQGKIKSVNISLPDKITTVYYYERSDKGE